MTLFHYDNPRGIRNKDGNLVDTTEIEAETQYGADEIYKCINGTPEENWVRDYHFYMKLLEYRKTARNNAKTQQE